MNSYQKAKQDAFGRIQQFNITHSADIATVDGYDLEKADFDAAVDAYAQAALEQTADLSGNALASQQQMAAMAKTIVKFALRAVIKARRLGNTSLAEQLDHPESYMLYADKVDAMARANSMKDAMKNNTATLTNLAQADIDAMEAAIKAVQDAKTAQSEAKIVKKSTGTDLLQTEMQAADTAANNMYSLLQSYYADSNPALVNEFHLAMQATVIGTMHSSVHIAVQDDATSSPIAGATIAEAETKKSYTTDAEGNVNLDTHRIGKFHLTISATGKQSVTMLFTVQRGQSNELTVKLKNA